MRPQFFRLVAARGALELLAMLLGACTLAPNPSSVPPTVPPSPASPTITPSRAPQVPSADVAGLGCGLSPAPPTITPSRASQVPSPDVAGLGCGLSPTPESVTPAPTARAITPSPVPTRGATIPIFDHIFIIIEENHSFRQIIGNTNAPYLNRLAADNGLAVNYFAITHPSLPNYLTLIGGSDFGIDSDCVTCFINAPSLIDRLESADKTWKGYMESMPSPCFVGSTLEYAQKHNPFIYFNNIRTNAARCQRLVPFTQLAGDLASAATTPNFVWITPNLCNDMHDCAIGTGDAWLKTNLPALFNSPAWQTQSSALFIVGDEDDRFSNNQVALIVVSPLAKHGYQSRARYDHYSLLKTIESAWGLAALTANDSNASPLSDFWK